MSLRTRRFTTGLATAGLVLSLALPAVGDQAYSTTSEPSAVPMLFDVLLMRPLGLLATIGGAVLYAVPVAPILAITRPTDLGKPIDTLIGVPARFTFKDPIGQHP